MSLSLILLASAALQGAIVPQCQNKSEVCQVPLPPAEDLRALLGGKQQAWRITGNILTVVARRRETANLCCAIQTRLQRIDGDLQAAAIHVPEIESAIFDIRIITGEEWNEEHHLYRGPRAPAAAATADVVPARVISHVIPSAHLGENRRVEVYLPPRWTAGRRLPVIYSADGLASELAGIAEAGWRSGRLAPFIIVGVPSSRARGTVGCTPRCDGRSREYLIDIPGLPRDQSRFDAHARFIAEEVVPLIESTYYVSRRPADRVAAGYSSGGAWALTMAARRPDIFGGTIAMSVGWAPAAEAARHLRRGRIFIGAGRLEDRFFEQSVLAAKNAKAAGANVRLVTLNAGHSMENWTILFADALRWHFPAGRR